MSVFCRPDFWLCEADTSAGNPRHAFPEWRSTPDPRAPKFSSLVNTAAIIGGTDDYRCASGQVKIDGNNFELTIETRETRPTRPRYGTGVAIPLSAHA